jgi:nucleoside-diphosphate-sugar epimerase
MLDGQPGYPKINTCVVDARDAADLHLRAMTAAAAKGERFLAASGEKARRLLGWKPRSREESILATAESLIRLGLVNTAR